MTDKQNLISLFKNCFNILRNNEHLTGSDALNTLALVFNY